MNKVILIGRFTRDPESRMSQSNMEIARFSLACQGEFVSRNGEREVEFINCVAFNRLATTINKYCRKGTLISATGRIRNNSYDAQDGSKRYVTEVIAQELEFMGSRPTSAPAPTQQFGGAQMQTSSPMMGGAAASFGSEVPPDEEIPF